MNQPTLQSRVRQYLRERRRLGFQLRSMGGALRSFARQVDKLENPGPLTVELMAEWARRDRAHSDDPRTWARRLKILRPFTRWLQQFEPRTEVPDDAIFGRIGGRLTPHIYSEQEIVDLLAAARHLRPDLRGATYEALFGLLAATGLRVSEAVRLRTSDVDLKTGMLTVQRTKFAKSRQVPLHPSVVEALRRYRRLRDPLIELTEETPFFVGARGRRRGQMLTTRQVDRVFADLRTRLAWPNRGAHSTPRVHDMRHNSRYRIIPHSDVRGRKYPENLAVKDTDDSALSEVLQEGHQAIIGAVARCADIGGSGLGQRLFFELHIRL
jgi:integrase